ncbi:MAG: trehalase family glycosidase [Saccharofermentanales bacterium]
MNISSKKIIEKKVYGHSDYMIELSLKAKARIDGFVEIRVLEHYLPSDNPDYIIYPGHETIAYKIDCLETNWENKVAFNFRTKINVSYLSLELNPFGMQDSIAVSDIKIKNVSEFADYENLSKRKPWSGPNIDFKKNDFDWVELLKDAGTYFQSGNMLIEQTGIENSPQISVLPDYPGIQNVVFFPSSTAKIDYIGQVEGGLVADVAKLHFFDGETEIFLKRDWTRWYPNKIEMGFSSDDINITQASTITWDDQIVCKIDVKTTRKHLRIKSACNFNRNCAGVVDVLEHNGKPYILAQNGLKVYLAFSSTLIASKDNFTFQNEPMEYGFEADCKEMTYYLFASAGLERDHVETRLFEAIENPQKIFEKSYKFWNDYLTKTVPLFESGNLSLKRLYYMNCYSHMANCFDVYYDPYLYPYVCPNKTLWKPQWPWNTMWGALAERWLNDISFSEGGVRSELILNTVLGYQFDLKPLDEFIRSTVFAPGLANSNNCAAANYPMLDLFKRNGDANFLKSVYKFLRDLEYSISQDDFDGDGVPEFWGDIDEYDQSVRWLGLYIDDDTLPEAEEGSGMNAWMLLLSKNQEKRLFGHTKALLIDYSSFLYILRRNLATISDFYGMYDVAGIYRQKSEELKKAINDKMWSEEEGFYFDYSLKRDEINVRWIISGITPLMGMIASKEQAERAVENLTDTTAMIEWEGVEYKAGKFCWNCYPPSTASVLNKYWRADEKSGYGFGQTILTGGARYTLEALINYGFYKEARYLINKLFEMQTTVNNNSLHLPYTYNSLTGIENRTHMSQQTAIFNDIIVSYIIGIRLRMDNKFEFMPFDVLKDYGCIHFGPLTTKTYPIEVDWDEKRYSVKINDKEYVFPYLTKWVIPVDELECKSKDRIEFNVRISSNTSSVGIFEVKGAAHNDEYTFLRFPVGDGFERKFILSVNELKGYEGVIDFAVYSQTGDLFEVMIDEMNIISNDEIRDYAINEFSSASLEDPVQKSIEGRIIQRIVCNF